MLTGLAELEPKLEATVAAAAAIGCEGSPADRKILNEHVHGLRSGVERATARAQQRKRDAVRAASSREDLERQLAAASAQIRQKMAPVRANEFLGLDPQDVERKISKCKVSRERPGHRGRTQPFLASQTGSLEQSGSPGQDRPGSLGQETAFCKPDRFTRAGHSLF